MSSPTPPSPVWRIVGVGLWIAAVLTAAGTAMRGIIVLYFVDVHARLLATAVVLFLVSAVGLMNTIAVAKYGSKRLVGACSVLSAVTGAVFLVAIWRPPVPDALTLDVLRVGASLLVISMWGLLIVHTRMLEVVPTHHPLLRIDARAAPMIYFTVVLNCTVHNPAWDSVNPRLTDSAATKDHHHDRIRRLGHSQRIQRR